MNAHNKKALNEFSKMTGPEVKRALFVIKVLKSLDVDLDHDAVKTIFENAFEASEIVPRHRVELLIEELVELEGPRVWKS